MPERGISLGSGFMSRPSRRCSFQIAFTQQYRAALEKKKKEQQRKFFVSGKKSVSKEHSRIVIEELFQAFTINYAAEDDRIRSLWPTILEEERKLQKLSKQFQSAIVKMGQECETEQIQGMAKAKEAVLEIEILHTKRRPLTLLPNGYTEGSEPIKAVSTGKVSGLVDEVPKDEEEFKAPDVLGTDPEDDDS
ncbi:hypothetical protein DFH05DRAFT_1461940 [Lentinula detonsa]|uniref:Uncharacterized protein n=1 Tax=Lentinula detonsa TaxID=2804962 RepID=A0A9W8NVQ9_9AGAR|nr:hypothetical protein DFH05DRAFT_1461940 [Lentinula detonsa]